MSVYFVSVVNGQHPERELHWRLNEPYAFPHCGFIRACPDVKFVQKEAAGTVDYN